MKIDTHLKSSQLLEAIANEIYDRETPPKVPFTFTIKDIQCVERWLKDLLKELKSANE